MAATCVVVLWLTWLPNRAEATSVAAIEALFASVNPAVSQGKDLQEALTKAFDVVASMPSRSSSVRRALYPSIAELFNRLEKGSEVPRFDLSSLKSLLFGSDVEVEAVRLLRANAIVAVTKAARWLREEVKSEVQGVREGELAKSVIRVLDRASQ